MKKSDRLFNDEFVHFMWDNSLKGKEGFIAPTIRLLINCVEHNVRTNHWQKLEESHSPDLPFHSITGIDYGFVYYDPNYEFKRAWMENKKVQYLTTIYVKNKWEDVPDEWYWDGNDGTQYRIAPEKTWRPFKDVDELKKVWDIKLTGRTDIAHAYVLTEPMIWVRSKSNTKSTYLITHYCGNEGVVYLCGYLNVSLEKLFEDYTFLDGGVMGVAYEE